MTKDEVLDLVLDWLVCYKDKSMSRNNADDLAEELIAAIKQARSAPYVASPRVQSAERGGPAGHVVSASLDHAVIEWSKQTSTKGGGDPRNAWSWPVGGEAVYLAPPAAPVQEPVAWMKEGWGPDCGPYIEFYRDDEMGWRDRKEWTPLYTTPSAAQRQWVGLTDEQIADYLGNEYHNMTESELRFFKLGEQAYKENT
jgi:hypothetical protein